MTESGDRAERLSPERQKLFEALLRNKRAQAARQRSAPLAVRSAPPQAITADDFDFDSGKPIAKHQVQAFYDAVSEQLNASAYGEYSLFLNYGYVPNDAPSFATALPRERHLNKNPIRLVLELVGELAFEPESRCLDIGCGRGGTLSVLRETFGVKHCTGVDLAPSAIDFCRAHYAAEWAEFLVGDAEALPLPGRSYDVVTNVESSHSYNEIEAFYSEVARVLVPGGHFLYTDVFPREDLATREAQLQGLGLEMRRRQDITSNVILACDEKAATNAAAFAEGNDQGIMRRFLGVPDSGLYNAMKNGDQRYMIYRFTKKA
jgi:SAM-dependent methyltransferase